MDAGHVAALRDIRREFVEFAADSHLIGPGVWHHVEAFRGWLNRRGNDKRLIKKRFEHGDASAGHGSVSGPIRWMKRTSFGIHRGKKVRTKLRLNKIENRRLQQSRPADWIISRAAQCIVNASSVFLRAEPPM